MELTYQQIRAVTHGAVRVREKEDGIRFFRLTEEQMEMFREDNPDIMHNCAGIKLVFRTNSRSLALKAFIEGTLYWWPVYSFDVQVNGETIGHMDNFSHLENFVPEYDMKMTYGQVQGRFDLGEEEKVVTVHLPWCKQFLLQQVELDDGAFAEPVQKKKLLMYGDSITQGYSATRPACRMAAYLAAALDMEECNRAVAGTVFLPRVAACRDEVSPDLITVAYGINDWYRGKTAAEFYADCSLFVENVRRNHPEVPIFVISPVCCLNAEPEKPHCAFAEIGRQLQLACQNFEQVCFISGEALMPRDHSLFFDGLHPNDKGFTVYAENLTRAIQALL